MRHDTLQADAVIAPNSRLLGHTGAHRNDSRPQNSMLEKGTSSPDKSNIRLVCFA